MNGLFAFVIRSPEPFVHWLGAHAPDAEVGVAREAGGCPIASFLLARGAERPQVSLELITFDFRGESYCFPTPTPLALFIRAIDTEAQYGQWIVTAGQALQVLNQVMTTVRVA